jgi:hypothetical protein
MHRHAWRRRALLIGLVALTAILFPAILAARAAHTPGHALASTDCGTPGAAHDHGTFVRGSASSGNVPREPSLGETPEEVPPSAVGQGGPGFRATVDTWVHVVSDGPTGNVSDQAVRDQIDVLNDGFGGLEGGVATGFTYRLAGITRTSNAAWHNAGPGSKDERDMKKALHRGDASDLNIYLTTAGPYLGWAYFPSTYKTRPFIDGIVVDWESMVGTSTRYEDQYDLGKTATHEAGHWLGLHHVFQGGCSAKGDYVDDTPPQKTATFGCPGGQDSCTKDPGIDSIHNYMDYSFDSCYNQFTAGQAMRMQDQWLHFRADGGFTVKH